MNHQNSKNNSTNMCNFNEQYEEDQTNLTAWEIRQRDIKKWMPKLKAEVLKYVNEHPELRNNQWIMLSKKFLLDSSIQPIVKNSEEEILEAVEGDCYCGAVGQVRNPTIPQI